jgi:hypothetical protein
MPGSAAISLVNAGVNVVSPPWVTETLEALGMKGVPELPAAVVARAYVQSVTGSQSGAVLEPSA